MTLPYGIVLRAASAQDMETIGELAVTAYVDGGHLSLDSPYTATLRDVRPRLHESVVLTTTEADELVASVAALPHGHALAEATEPGEWEFRYLAVRRDHWGKGLGRFLVDEVERRARSAGANQVVLRVIDTNARARDLYEHLGYVHRPARDLRFTSDGPPERLITLYLLAKPLR